MKTDAKVESHVESKVKQAAATVAKVENKETVKSNSHAEA